MLSVDKTKEQYHGASYGKKRTSKPICDVTVPTRCDYRANGRYYLNNLISAEFAPLKNFRNSNGWALCIFILHKAVCQLFEIIYFEMVLLV